MAKSILQSGVGRVAVIVPSGLVMATLMGAGLLKAIDVPQFALAVEAWKVVPSMLAWPIALGVVAAEIGLSFAWFLNLQRRLVSAAALSMLAMFTAVYLIESYFNEPPDCSCLGAWAKFRMTEHVVLVQVIRNSILMGMLGFGLVLPVFGRIFARRSEAERVTETSVPTNSRGMTIIEVLVVILIIGLLFALAIGPLGKARGMGTDLVSLANLKTHVSTVAMYASDYEDFFPMYMDPKAPKSTFGGSGSPTGLGYFTQSEMWPVLMADEYYEGQWPHPSQRRPGERKRWNSYMMSSTMMASPAFWNLETRTGPDQYRASRIAEVSFASQKAIFTETSLEFRPGPYGKKERPVNLGLADGSADGFSDAELTEPIRSGEGNSLGWRYNYGLYGMHTVNGLRGIDVK